MARRARMPSIWSARIPRSSAMPPPREIRMASQLRDVAFTDYASNPIAQAAAAELNKLTAYRGPRDSSGHVTTENLFHGVFPGEQVGPYISQFMITPTSFGQQPISQLMTTYTPGIDYMTDETTFFQVQ